MKVNLQDKPQDLVKVDWKPLAAILLVPAILVILLIADASKNATKGSKNNPLCVDWTGFCQDEITSKSEEKTVDKGLLTTIKTTETTQIQSGKTLWDWLQLSGSLAVPIILVILGNQLQRRADKEANARDERETILAQNQADLDKKIASENLRDEALEKYFDCMSELLIKDNLKKILNDNHPVTDMARTRTLSILRRLKDDSGRKTNVICFLMEAEIIQIIKNIEPRFITGVDLSGVDFSGIDLGQAKFSGVNLSGANLTGVDLSQAELTGADLSKAILFRAKLNGVKLSGSSLEKANLLEADLSQANLEGAKLSQATLFQAQLIGANLNKANLNEAILSQANLNEAILSQANLNKANLIEANLSEAHLEQANLIEADLTRAILYEAELTKANLFKAELGEVNLLGAKLSGSSLFAANLSGANLFRSDLKEANLGQANLSGAVLFETQNLSSRQIKSACYWEQAIYSSYDFNQEQHRFIALDGDDNQQIIENYRRDRDSSPKEPIDCSRWH